MLSFRRGQSGADNHALVGKLARVESITKEIAIAAARFEAGILDAIDPKKTRGNLDNPRRKWDAFHLATAVELGCRTLYALDDKFETRKRQLRLSIEIASPAPREPVLIDVSTLALPPA